MKFGAVEPKQAVGATSVHTIRSGGLVLKKGTLIGPIEAAALEAAGIKDVVVARLEPGDVTEDAAAADIAMPSRATARMSIALSPGAPTFSRKQRACLSSTKRPSIGSIASMKPSR